MAGRRYFKGRYCPQFVPVLTRDGVPTIQLLAGFDIEDMGVLLNTRALHLYDLEKRLYRTAQEAAIKTLGVEPEDYSYGVSTSPDDPDIKYERRLQKKLEDLVWSETRRYAFDVYGFPSVYWANRVLRGLGDCSVDGYLVGRVVLGPRGGSKFVEV